MKDIILTIGAGIGVFLLFIGLIFIFSFIFAFPVMWLWNWLIPDLFQLKQITYWEAWGIFLLCGLLFRGINYKSND